MIRDNSTQPLRLAQLRREKGFTQLELAFHSRTQAADISRYESGRLTPYKPTLLRIARVLGVPAKDAATLLLPVSATSSEAR